MTHDDRRSAAEADHAPRQVPLRRGNRDASNTPIEELVAPLEPDEDAEVRGLIRQEVTAQPELLAGVDGDTRRSLGLDDSAR